MALGEGVEGGDQEQSVIRVVFCVDNLQVGGTELNAVRTAERLNRTRFDLSLVCLGGGGPLEERYVRADVPILRLPLRSLYSPSAAGQALRLARWLRKRRVQVFHAHDIYSNIFGVPCARLAGVPGVIASRRWWAGRRDARLRFADRAAHRLAHASLVNASPLAELLREEGVPPAQVEVVPNFLDDAAFDSPPAEFLAGVRRELALPEGAPVIGIVANLRAVKDHETLLRAVAALAPRRPDVHLVLVGEGDRRSPLEALATELGIAERVRFAGRRPSHPSFHHLFDISVLSSLSEGMPNSVLEAMAAGRPVVATNVGGTRDAVVDSVTGYLVPPRDPARMAAALDALLSDPDHARGMGEAGARRAREVFRAENALAALEDLYVRIAHVRDDTRPAAPTESPRKSGPYLAPNASARGLTPR